MEEYTQILNDNEKVLWKGKPQFAPFLAKSFIVVPFGLFFLGFSIFWTINASAVPGIFSLFGIPFILAGLSVVFSPLYSLLVYRNVYYVITDKRVILQGGVIGRDFEIIDFDKIQSSNVNVGLSDKLVGQNSGSISIDAGRIISRKNGSESNPYKLNSISNPYKAFEFLKSVSFDVKTDIEYPNALRPKNNPGYETEYNSKI